MERGCLIERGVEREFTVISKEHANKTWLVYMGMCVHTQELTTRRERICLHGSAYYLKKIVELHIKCSVLKN